MLEDSNSWVQNCNRRVEDYISRVDDCNNRVDFMSGGKMFEFI